MRKLTTLFTLIALVIVAAVPLGIASAQDGDGDTPPTIAQIAASDERFSTLASALDAAGLTETFDADGAYTVFAPTNAAFDAALEQLGMTADELLADTELLTTVLQYHVVDGVVMAADVAGLDSAETLAGETITISMDGDTVVLNDGQATVTEADVNASNGVVHVIDGVLLPPSLTEGMTDAAPAEDTEAAAQSLAYLRVAHFAADAPAVQVYLDGEASNIQELNFGAISGWVEMPANTYEIAIVPVSGTLDDVVVGPVNYTFQPNTWTTLAVVGSLEDGSLTVQVLREDYTRIDEDMARVAVLHAIPDAPAVDVLVNDEVAISNLSYSGGRDFNSGYTAVDVPVGTVNIKVVPTGATEPVLLEASDVELEAGTYYFIAATGSADEPQAVIESVSEALLSENTQADLGQAGATEGQTEDNAMLGDATATPEDTMDDDTMSDNGAADATPADNMEPTATPTS